MFCSRAAARKLLLFFQCGQSIADRISPSPYLPSRLSAPRSPATSAAAGDVHLALTAATATYQPRDCGGAMWAAASLCWCRTAGSANLGKRFLLPLSTAFAGAAAATAAAFAHTLALPSHSLALFNYLSIAGAQTAFLSLALTRTQLYARYGTLFSHDRPRRFLRTPETTHRLPFLSISSFFFLHHHCANAH